MRKYLAAVLGRQVASRAVNGTSMRISAARFPQVKTLALSGVLPAR